MMNSFEPWRGVAYANRARLLSACEHRAARRYENHTRIQIFVESNGRGRYTNTNVKNGYTRTEQRAVQEMMDNNEMNE